MTPAGACSEAADLSVGVRERAKVFHRRGQIAHRLIVGKPTLGAHSCSHVVGRTVPSPVIQVGGNGHVAVVRELPSRLTVPLVPSRHVMGEHHAGIRPRP